MTYPTVRWRAKQPAQVVGEGSRGGGFRPPDFTRALPVAIFSGQRNKRRAAGLTFRTDLTVPVHST